MKAGLCLLGILKLKKLSPYRCQHITADSIQPSRAHEVNRVTYRGEDTIYIGYMIVAPGDIMYFLNQEIIFVDPPLDYLYTVEICAQWIALCRNQKANFFRLTQLLGRLPEERHFGSQCRQNWGVPRHSRQSQILQTKWIRILGPVVVYTSLLFSSIHSIEDCRPCVIRLSRQPHSRRRNNPPQKNHKLDRKYP